eukprot:TRINITY_DN1658_c0_g5_i1.p1 TRINITY_DN1658_c0_g5~~TRINITY_DN1658_c0_g5_i1.p1  ORF type:complete len:144 (+),score=18.28 TRINITY_DN1658_c0_g5_i1:74-505(+)
MASIGCVAIIGKENEPLFIQTFTDSKDENSLKLHYYVYTSLDVIEEKVATQKKSVSGGIDLFFGQLFSIEEYKIYGYSTNTKIKFIAIVQGNGTDSGMKSWLRDFHSLFVATMCNPFCELNQKIESKTFEDNVARMVKNFGRY